MSKFQSTKLIELGSCAFRQPKATSHCKYIHGYQLLAKVWIGANALDSNNWVFDFGSFKELTTILQKTFDHKLVIDKNDPAKPAFKELERYGAADIVEMDGVGIEKFAQCVFDHTDTFVKFTTQDRAWCNKVEVFEHAKNSAIYCKENKTDTMVHQQEPPAPPVTVAPQVVVPDVAPPPQRGPQPVPLYNPVTTGWSNPFAGTSWGA